MSELLYAKYNSIRKPEYQLATFIRQDGDIREITQDIDEGLQLGTGIDRTGGVVGRAEDKHAGTLRQRRTELVGRKQVIILVGGLYGNDLSFRQLNHLGIAYPRRHGNDDFIPGIDERLDGIVDSHLGADGD